MLSFFLLFEKNMRLGYGDSSDEWKKEKYNVSLKKLNNAKKLAEEQKRVNLCNKLQLKNKK